MKQKLASGSKTVTWSQKNDERPVERDHVAITCAPQVETMIHHYAFGKPKETVTFQDDSRFSVEAFRKLAGLDDGDPDEPEPKPKPKKPPKAPTQMLVGALAKKKVLARH